MMTDWIVADISDKGAGAFSIKHVRTLATHEYDRLIAAAQCLRTSLHRITFSVLTQNYQQFCALEQEVTARVASADPRAKIQPEALQIAVTTAVVNYLTSMHMFLDHSETELRRRDAQDGGNRLETWNLACSAEYDDYFAYRFLYRFRNFILHVGLPLSNLEISSRLNDDGHTAGSVFLGESAAHLVADFNGWSTVKSELQSLSTDIDLSEQIHVSMECLTRIAEVLLREDIPELATSVATFNSIVGDSDAYIGEPLLVKVEDRQGSPILEVRPLYAETFRMAERIVALQRHKRG